MTDSIPPSIRKLISEAELLSRLVSESARNEQKLHEIANELRNLAAKIEAMT